MANGSILLHGKNGKYINKKKPTFTFYYPTLNPTTSLSLEYFAVSMGILKKTEEKPFFLFSRINRKKNNRKQNLFKRHIYVNIYPYH